MPWPLPYAELFVLLACAAFFRGEIYGVIFLLGGIVCFNRNFAYSHLSLGSLPIYLPEACVAAWLGSTLWRSRANLHVLWCSVPHRIRLTWGLFALMSLYAFARGVLFYNPLNAMRDSAMFYYSSVIFLTASMLWTKRQLQILLNILVVLSIIPALHDLAVQVPPLLPTTPYLIGQPAALAAAHSILLIFLLVVYEFRLPTWGIAASILILSSILTGLVRSSWVGLGLSLPFAIWGVAHLVGKAVCLKRIVLTGVLVLFGALMILKLLTATQEFVKRNHVSALTDTPSQASAAPLNAQPSVPAPQIRLEPSEAAVPLLQKAKRHLTASAPDPTPTTKRYRGYIAPNVGKAVENEFLSIFRGLRSDNMNTRVLMWRNAVWELLSIELFSPRLRAEDLVRYNLPGVMPQTPDGRHYVTIFDTGDPGLYVPLQTTKDYTVPLTSKEWLRIAHRFLFGVSYGKPYLPPEIVWTLHSPNRFDPHNSILAVLYRVGLIGFLGFAGLSVMGLLFTYRGFQRSQDAELRRYYLAIFTALIYFLVHSLTDNTLENAFKGLWYWFLLGLAFGISRMEPVRPDRSTRQAVDKELVV